LELALNDWTVSAICIATQTGLLTYLCYVEHSRLFGESVDQHLTQQMFYTFLEPEVLACQKGFQLIKSPNLAQKLHKKKFLKFSNYYLLDKLELNTKARCVFCWTGIGS
jgi:hypothetical protein